MSDYRWAGDEPVYVPSLGKLVQPGETVTFPTDPLSSLFEPVPAKPAKPAKE